MTTSHDSPLSGPTTNQPADIPDGYYAVPDPDNPERLTLWHVDGDHLVASPTSAHYGPVLHRKDVPAGLSKPDKSRWVANWFETVQRPWRVAVHAAIAADPNAAGALYAKTAVRCRDCGRPLKDETSKAAGRGPDCRAQRASAVARTDTTGT